MFDGCKYDTPQLIACKIIGCKVKPTLKTSFTRQLFVLCVLLVIHKLSVTLVFDPSAENL